MFHLCRGNEKTWLVPTGVRRSRCTFNVKTLGRTRWYLGKGNSCFPWYLWEAGFLDCGGVCFTLHYYVLPILTSCHGTVPL